MTAILSREIWVKSTNFAIKAWIRNHFHVNIWKEIIRQWPNFKLNHSWSYSMLSSHILDKITALGLWWASQVVGDNTMTEIEVSISILSWCLKTYSICADLGIYKQKIAHKTASNQPLWKAWPQTIVTAASLVTSWIPLWCHSDARVTKSWQYASLKNKQKQ